MLGLLSPLDSFVGMEAGGLAKRVKAGALLWASIALFAAIALVFALVALHTATVAWLGELWAPLAIAGGAALVAGAIYLTARITSEIAHRRAARKRRSSERTALVTTAAVTALPVLMKSPLMKTIGLPLGGALAAAFLLTRSGTGQAGDVD